MEYQVLARKFRPKKFEEILGQKHISAILQNAIKSNTIAHAYLFCGTRGVGKTSAARIFAKAVMCSNRREDGNPCLECASCKQVDDGSSLDYLEIDGASNNSVENVRDLIDNVQFLPITGKYKVYVIDEVHMLSSSAFNALLKTLEEPPAHVIFIFATTDPHKLLDTVVSRCQRLEFKNLGKTELKSLLLGVAKNEGLSFESDEVINTLCEIADGSGRDVLSILELVKSYSAGKTITHEALTLTLGVPEKSTVLNFAAAMLGCDYQKASALFEQIVESSVDILKFHQQLQKMLFDLIEKFNLKLSHQLSSILLEKEVTLAELIWVYEVMAKDYEWVAASSMLEQNLKLLYMKLTLRRQILTNETIVSESTPKKKVEFEPEPEPQLEPEPEPEIEKLNYFEWKTFLAELYQSHSSLAVNLERGNLLEEARLREGRLTLIVGFSETEKLFYDVLSEAETKKKIIQALKDKYDLLEDGLNIQFRLLSEVEKDEKQFKSTLEIEEEKVENEMNQKREKLLNNVFIKSAQEIFESQVNKIILNE